MDEAATNSRRVGDERAEARATLVRFQLQLGSDGTVGDIGHAVAAVGEAIESFERLADAEGLARAWHLLCVIDGTAGRTDSASEAAERAVEIAKAAGDAG